MIVLAAATFCAWVGRFEGVGLRVRPRACVHESMCAQERPGAAQDGPGPSQERPRATQSGPRAVQRPSWTHLGSFWDSSGGQNHGFSLCFSILFEKQCFQQNMSSKAILVLNLGHLRRPRAPQERPRAAQNGPRAAKSSSCSRAPCRKHEVTSRRHRPLGLYNIHVHI